MQIDGEYYRHKMQGLRSGRNRKNHVYLDELDADDAEIEAKFRADASFYIVPNPCSDPKLENTFSFEAVNRKDFFIEYADDELIMGSL